MKAKIIRIDEPDFGCEGRMDEQIVLDRVTLQTASGEIFETKAEDAWLYTMEINEGDLVEVEEETKEIIGKAGDRK